MPIESFDHTFFDIEVEMLDEAVNLQLIKILCIDGRRFTYQMKGLLDDHGIAYVKSVIDAACFGDMLIERNGDDYTITEAPKRLKKHS